MKLTRCLPFKINFTIAVLIIFLSNGLALKRDALGQESAPNLAFAQPLEGSAYRNIYGKLPRDATRGDVAFQAFFKIATAKLASSSLNNISTKENWLESREMRVEQLKDMLGLSPMPARTDLQARITGAVQGEGFTVEKLVFQSRPGLYVTANIYVPDGLSKPAPTVLYVSGHGPVKIDGVSYGNKVSYQHHGAWFAQNGYVCMVMDTVQMGEIEGIHHGTYREGMWWWNSRGYTPAGVEAWNCVRAIDYLQTRDDVEPSKIGITGRSGGGVYSWWAAAIDDRIAAACPVAGITDMQNHVVDGCVEGHCDCMFMVNKHQWDFAEVAALHAPRPLLICNTDKDTIFPLDGVLRLHSKTRNVYDLLDAHDKLGLLIAEGDHQDSADLQVPVMRWFNRWLKEDDGPINGYAKKLFQPQQLKVLENIPSDQISSVCHESFTKLADENQQVNSEVLKEELLSNTFSAVRAAITSNQPATKLSELASSKSENLALTVYEFASQPHLAIQMFVLEPSSTEAKSVRLIVVDDDSWTAWSEFVKFHFPNYFKLATENDNKPNNNASGPPIDFEKLVADDSSQAIIVVAPIGTGPTALGGNEAYKTHVRRRIMLLGSTLATYQTLDVIQAIRQLRTLDRFSTVPIHLNAASAMTEVTSFATLFSDDVETLELTHFNRSDKNAPDFLNWSRVLTPAQLDELLKAKTKLIVNQ